MIKRELYMKRIRPFIGREIIKVLTGIRRSGKSVMLSLIPQYVVSLDEFDRGRNGIRHRNIRDFLLEKSWT